MAGEDEEMADARMVATDLHSYFSGLHDAATKIMAAVSMPADLKATLFQLSDSGDINKQIMAAISPIAGALASYQDDVVAPMVRKLADWRRQIDQQLQPVLEEMQRFHDKLPGEAKTATVEMANHGWFPDLSMHISSVRQIGSYLQESGERRIGPWLASYFEKNSDRIVSEIAKKFPRRAGILNDALWAHRQKKYTLSVPVFLAQTDGICQEVTHKSPFRMNNKRRETAEIVERFENDALLSALAHPLVETVPLNANRSQRPPGFHRLNRHTVLHGESTNYATKRNSLKSLSFLNYIVQVLEQTL